MPHDAMHPDKRSHKGGAMSLRRGVIYGTSKRHKLSMNSSRTELEKVTADHVLPHMLWTLYFLEAQSYKMGNNILYIKTNFIDTSQIFFFSSVILLKSIAL